MQHLLGAKPGDPCPSSSCAGVFKTITFNWDLNGLHGEATCSVCQHEWCLTDEGLEPIVRVGEP